MNFSYIHKIKLLLYLSSIALFISSCASKSFYIPAAAGNDISYLPKPMESDSIKVKNYISASLSGVSLPRNTGNIDLGFLNISRGHTFKNFNVAYGIYGFAGQASYDQEFNNGKAELNGKGIYGGGLRSSIGFYDNAGNAEFRIISWDNSLSFENGSYATFRQEMYNLHASNIISSTKNSLYTTGISSEIIWHSKRNWDNHFAFKLFYGKSIGLNKSLENFAAGNTPKGGAFSSSFYIKLKNLFGIVDVNFNKNSGGKLSLGYAF